MSNDRHELTSTPRGWHSRGYLPHFDGPERTQAVTFRLADALPKEVLSRLQANLMFETEHEKSIELRQRIHEWLDAGHGECLLRDPRCAKIVQDAILHFHDERYVLHNWCVMPNHVHVLFTPGQGRSLSGIVQSWKSFTAKAINRLLGRSGTVWMADYFDRYIRDEKHFNRAMAYIDDNPVKAGLCRTPEDWPWGAAAARK